MVGTSVSVGVGVKVGVGGAVLVGVGVSVGGLRKSCPCGVKYKRSKAPPTSAKITTAAIPATVAKLTGRRLRDVPAPTRGMGWVVPVLALALTPDKSAPHTKHLVAAAPTRVPQVGHSR